MKRYFDHITTADELRKEYHRLAMIHHPDHGGDTATMQAINAQYDEAGKRIASGAAARRPETEGTGAAESFNAAAFRAAVMAAVRWPDITLELVGSWLWATGNTFGHREALKAAGYRWSKGHKAWYYHDETAAVRKASKLSLEEIKVKYGSSRIIPTGWTGAALSA